MLVLVHNLIFRVHGERISVDFLGICLCLGEF